MTASRGRGREELRIGGGDGIEGGERRGVHNGIAGRGREEKVGMKVREWWEWKLVRNGGGSWQGGMRI